MFYICFYFRRFVEGKICRKFALCFVQSILKKRSFLTSCVFWFVSLNASSHLCFWFFTIICLSRLGRQWISSNRESIYIYISVVTFAMWRDHDQTPEGAMQLPEWPGTMHTHTLSWKIMYTYMCIYIYTHTYMHACIYVGSGKHLRTQNLTSICAWANLRVPFFMQGGAKKRNILLILFFLNHLNSWRRNSLSYMVLSALP